jgi:hypothetical protein
MADRNLTNMRANGVYTTREGMVLEIPADDVFKVNYIPRTVDPFSQSTSQEFPLGTKLTYADRVFRYALNGAVLGVTGSLYQAVVPLAGHIDEVIGTHGIGDTAIDFTPNTVTTDDLAANELVNSYININDDTGEGQLLRIKSHPAIVGGVLGVLTLIDPVHVAIGANATGTVLHNPFWKVIIHASPPTAGLAGVMTVPVAAASYCWLQTKGPASVLTQGTLVIGDLCVPSATVDGAVMPSAALETDGPMVGHVLAVNATGEHSIVRLILE